MLTQKKITGRPGPKFVPKFFCYYIIFTKQKSAQPERFYEIVPVYWILYSEGISI